MIDRQINRQGNRQADRQAKASGEDTLIARYFKPLATDPGAFNLDDDAAALKPSGDDIVVTTDAIVEGVHFFADDPPDTVARKALRVNLSDLAAKGAAPAGFVLTLALRNADDAWLKPFAEALGEDATQFGCPLLGGDTVSTPGPLMISVTAIWPVTVIRRSARRIWTAWPPRGRSTPTPTSRPKFAHPAAPRCSRAGCQSAAA